MTYLEAAHTILTQAGQPLHYAEITRRALDQALIEPTGLTPEATMGSRLYTDTKDESSQFVRAGRGLFDLATHRPSGIDAQVHRINQETRTQLHQLLLTMPPARFEALITELLLQMGFDEQTVQVTPYSKDGGIDVVGIYHAAGLTQVDAAVQVKRWKHNVQSPTVTQLRGSLQVHQQGIIITTSDFSAGARKEAAAPNKTRIGLINGAELLDLLIKHRVGVVEKNLKVVSLDDEWWGELFIASVPAPKPALPPAATSTVNLVTPASEPTGHKPQSFTLLGHTYPVTSWKELLIHTCNTLAATHGADFAAKVVTLHGRKRHYIAHSADGMISRASIAGAGLWVETNQSARSILALIERLLTAFAHSPADLCIVYHTSTGTKHP